MHNAVHSFSSLDELVENVQPLLYDGAICDNTHPVHVFPNWNIVLPNGALPARSTAVYAWGCGVFEATTGTPLFTGSAGDLAMQHRTQPPPLHTLPKAIRPIVARALDLNPRRQYESAYEFLEAIVEAVLLPAPVEVTPAVGVGQPTAIFWPGIVAGVSAPAALMAWEQAASTNSMQYLPCIRLASLFAAGTAIMGVLIACRKRLASVNAAAIAGAVAGALLGATDVATDGYMWLVVAGASAREFPAITCPILFALAFAAAVWLAYPMIQSYGVLAGLLVAALVGWVSGDLMRPPTIATPYINSLSTWLAGLLVMSTALNISINSPSKLTIGFLARTRR